MTHRWEVQSNKHPNLDGSPWGWVRFGTRRKDAVWSGRDQRELARQFVEAHNATLKETQE